MAGACSLKIIHNQSKFEGANAEYKYTINCEQ